MIIHSSSQGLHSLQPRPDSLHARNNGQNGSNDPGQATPKTESAPGHQLNLAEQSQISELRRRDQEVRAHELAHLAAAGSLSKGGPTFEFALGPDGQRYAIGGEVQIDTSGVPGDPAVTLQKAIQIQQAALAPAQPSAQDRSVAIAAAAMAAEARAELASQESPDSKDDAGVQRIAARINETYNAVETNIQRASSTIDLVV